MRTIKRVRTLAGLVAVVMASAIFTASTAMAVERQNGGSPLRVEFSAKAVPDGMYYGTLARANGAPGYDLTMNSRFLLDGTGDGYAPGQTGQGNVLSLNRIVAHDGTGLPDDAKANVCSGGAQGMDSVSLPLPAIDLSSMNELTRLLDDGVIVPSGEWTGDSDWNPELAGRVWSPIDTGQTYPRIFFVDQRLEGVTSSTEWNMFLELHVTNFATPTWDCGAVPPFIPETGDEAPAAIPDQGVVPFGTSSIVVAVLDNDQLPNGASALEIIEGPANGEATVNTTSADWSVTYAPRAGFTGQDRFTYLVTDPLGKSSQTNVNIDVLGEVQVPVVPVVPEAPEILAPEAPVLEVPVVVPDPVVPDVIAPEVPVVVPEPVTPTPVVDPVPFEAKTGAEDLSLTSVMGLGVRTLAVVLFLGGIGASVAAFLYRRRAVR